eukprot:c11165_g1_i1.p1 GENE.c11165_g1_i1~~c11165_g1_i1.p1  ORF type:complete len:172 (+),score=31.95 c11165_g1_i1:61-576(+)
MSLPGQGLARAIWDKASNSTSPKRNSKHGRGNEAEETRRQSAASIDLPPSPLDDDFENLSPAQISLQNIISWASPGGKSPSKQAEVWSGWEEESNANSSADEEKECSPFLPDRHSPLLIDSRRPGSSSDNATNSRSDKLRVGSPLCSHAVRLKKMREHLIDNNRRASESDI